MMEKKTKQLCVFKLTMWELVLSSKTFTTIPKELVYVILGLSSIGIGVTGLLLNCWVILVDWTTILINSNVYPSYCLSGRQILLINVQQIECKTF